MPTPELAQRINDFEAGASTPRRWADGLSPAQLTSHPVPGTWSVQQVIVHVLDSDLAAGHRMRRVVAEDVPLLIAYDESRFAAVLHYERADIRAACDLFAMHRVFTASWLRTLSETDFARVGVHNQRGRVSLRQWIDLYIDHLTHHETFVAAKRAAIGAPLAPPPSSRG